MAAPSVNLCQLQLTRGVVLQMLDRVATNNQPMLIKVADVEMPIFQAQTTYRLLREAEVLVQTLKGFLV